MEPNFHTLLHFHACLWFTPVKCSWAVTMDAIMIIIRAGIQVTTNQHKRCQKKGKQNDVSNLEHWLDIFHLSYRIWSCMMERSIFFQNIHYVVTRYKIFTNWMKNQKEYKTYVCHCLFAPIMDGSCEVQTYTLSSQYGNKPCHPFPFRFLYPRKTV